MSEREKVLKFKRKKISKGRVIRISDQVFTFLEKKRAARGISFDNLLRKIFGIPKRDGSPNPILVGWLEITTGRFFLDEGEARGAACIAAARAKSKRPNAPVKMREAV